MGLRSQAGTMRFGGNSETSAVSYVSFDVRKENVQKVWALSLLYRRMTSWDRQVLRLISRPLTLRLTHNIQRRNVYSQHPSA